MVRQVNKILTESEKNRILNLYNLNNVVIVDWLSPDEKYAIFLDELYDIENKKKIGNIFENFDNFKFFLKHSFETAENISNQIKESLLESINSIVITESNQDMRGLKPYVKKLLQEWTANPFSKEFYSKQNWKDIGSGIKSTTSNAIEGLKNIYKDIKDGDWKSALDIIGKGILWTMRKIRAALYNPIGMILDAILIATGIGKSVQFVIWAVVVGLDIYELMSGNFENKDLSLPWRLLFFGIDILGMVTAGAAAKAGKSVVAGLINQFGKSAEGIKNAVKESVPLKSLIQNILKASSSASGFMQKAMVFLEKNAPTIYKFLKPVISGLGRFLTMMVNTLKEILGVIGKSLSAPGKFVEKIAPTAMKDSKFIKGAAGAANVIAPLGVINAYGSYKAGKSEEEILNALQASTVEPTYDESQF